jgi:hypothetical protein
MNAISYTIKIDINELSRLLTAATVSEKFRHLLLTNPAQALANGYNGEVFHLEAQYMDRIMSIQALSLHEFAQQLISQEPFNVLNDFENAHLAHAVRNVNDIR